MRTAIVGIAAFPVAGLLVAGLLVAGVATAEEAPRLTVSTAVERALAVHPAIASARARAAEAVEAIGEARASRGPVVYGAFGVTQNREAVPTSPIHGFSPDLAPEFDETQVQASLNASFNLLDSGARRARVRQAGAGATAATATLDVASQALAARVAAAYVTVLGRQDDVEAETARLEALGAERSRVQTLLDAGKVAELELLRADAALAGGEAAAVRASTALDAAERELARWLGLEVEATRANRLAPLATPSAPTADREALVGEALAASPAVAQARAQVAAAEAAKAFARAAYFPKLDALGALQELGGGDLDLQTEWNVGVQLRVPLWDGGVTDRRVARAVAGLAEATARLAQAELDVRAEIDAALAALAEATARAAALERAAERTAEVVRVQGLLLEVGRGTQVDALAAVADLASTRAALAQARAGSRLARIELARACGTLTPDWLATAFDSPSSASETLP